jgi:hypothetical protein
MWTYDPTQLLTSKLYGVRLLIGDTDNTSPQLQDEEINYAVIKRSSVYGAAADCCFMLAGKIPRQFDFRAGDTEAKYSQSSKAYFLLAMKFENMSASRGGGLPYAGGVSERDKDSQESSSDRVRPQFIVGMDDNFLPLAPVEATPRDDESTDPNQTS